jgi:hypothetical protein
MLISNPVYALLFFENEKKYFTDPGLGYGTVQYSTTPKIWSHVEKI